MNSITFLIRDITIELTHSEAMFWNGNTARQPDITLPIEHLKNALSTTHMLIKPDNTHGR